MKIIVAGGTNEADFLIQMLTNKKHQLIVINEDRDFCEHLSNTHDVEVFWGDPSKDYVLSDSGIHNADVFIAITKNDADNFVMSQMAKRNFGVKKSVAIVSNPKNVELFHKLGIEHAISSTYLVAQNIERVSVIDNLLQVITLGQDRVIISEVVLHDKSHLVGKYLKDLENTTHFNISCIFRNSDIIIPHGGTLFIKGDHLVLVCRTDDYQETIEYIQKREVKR